MEQERWWKCPKGQCKHYERTRLEMILHLCSQPRQCTISLILNLPARLSDFALQSAPVDCDVACMVRHLLTMQGITCPQKNPVDVAHAETKTTVKDACYHHVMNISIIILLSLQPCYEQLQYHFVIITIIS